MLKFVDELLKSQDNIIDQLKLLKENKNNREVKKYMKALVGMNLSPYYRYCIDKYYFELNVEEVKPPIPKIYPLYYLEGSEVVKKILDTKDNVIDQIISLKKCKDKEMIDIYFDDYLAVWANEYVSYCIKKYYYDLDVEEVEPTAKSLNIVLHPIYFRSIEKKQERIIKRKTLEARKKVKKGDMVRILNGPFNNMTGIFEGFNKNTMKSNVIINMFGLEISCECEDEFEIIKENNHEKKN